MKFKVTEKINGDWQITADDEAMRILVSSLRLENGCRGDERDPDLAADDDKLNQIVQRLNEVW